MKYQRREFPHVTLQSPRAAEFGIHAGHPVQVLLYKSGTELAFKDVTQVAVAPNARFMVRSMPSVNDLYSTTTPAILFWLAEE